MGISFSLWVSAVLKNLKYIQSPRCEMNCSSYKTCTDTSLAILKINGINKWKKNGINDFGIIKITEFHVELL